jgi:hypothetical protein
MRKDFADDGAGSDKRMVLRLASTESVEAPKRGMRFV